MQRPRFAAGVERPGLLDNEIGIQKLPRAHLRLTHVNVFEAGAGHGFCRGLPGRYCLNDFMGGKLMECFHECLLQLAIN